MRHNYKHCIDAGSENCPCRLAASGDCPVCSRLAGKDYCDCRWQGVCIYNEVKPGDLREGRLYEIQEIKWYEKNLAVMKVAVPRGFAEKASQPGSFVFAKKPESEPFFYTPVSIMRADYEQGFIELAVQEAGPKSKELLRCEGCIQIKGIYRNGLIGISKLEAQAKDPPRTQKKILCLAKGAALAPVANYCRWAGGRDWIDLIVDTEKITVEFAEYCLAGCRVNEIKYRKLPLEMTWSQQEEYDVILLAASDYYQKTIYIPEAKRVLSNNASMCCGEGVCGACIRTDENGSIYRLCKCNMK